MATPENIRAAAYLAARERLDFRRTQRVQCEAPNRQCGKRCIPPGWDCRLKGEGEDGHLRAVGRGSDPVAGFANIERGLSRLKKGALKLSFSELEGGRRAIARGTAKIAPGDLKQKKELQERVNQIATYIGGPVAVVVFAGLAHRGLKAFPEYARGPGAQVDDTLSNVFRTVGRSIPIYGRAVRAREAVGPTAINTVGRSVGRINRIGTESFTREPKQRQKLTQLVNNQASLTDAGFPTEYNNLLDLSLRKADGATNNRSRPSGLNYSEWDTRSLKSFWSTQRTSRVAPTGVNSKGSLFSVIATNKHIAQSFGMTAPSGADPKREGNEIISNIRGVFKATGEGIRTSMREAGLDTKSPEVVRDFIGRTRRSNPLDEETTKTLLSTVISADHDTQAKAFYSKVVAGYDKVFKNIVEDLDNAPSIELVANRNDPTAIGRLRQLRQTSFYNDAVVAHSQQTGRRLQLPSPVYGPYTGLLAKRAYHTRFVAGPRKLSGNNEINLNLTRTETFNAGIEIARAANLPEPSTVETALELVRRTYGQGSDNAIGSIGLVSTRQSQAPAPPSTPGQERSARRRARSRTQVIADLVRAGYSPEAAATEADRLRRRDARVDAYLLVRNDFTPTGERKGKACGKSFVPKQAKCNKPPIARYVDKPAGDTGGMNSSVKKPQTSGELATKVAAVAAGGLALAAGGRLAYKNRTRIKAIARTASVVTKKQSRKIRRETATAYNRTQIIAGVTSINALSSKQIRQGLDMVPEQWQAQTRSLVGRAKTAAAAMVLKADSSELVNVDTKNNFSTFKHVGGHYLTVGSSDDSLILFRSHSDAPLDFGGGNQAGKYIMDFQVDLKHDQKTGLTTTQSSKLVRTTKAMFNAQVKQLPDNSFVSVAAHQDDGLGSKRSRVYEKWGFRAVPGVNPDEMWAIKREGKFTRIKDEEADGVGLFLRNAGGQSAAPPRTSSTQGQRGSRTEIVQRLLRQRDSRGNPKYTNESAKKEAERIMMQRKNDSRADAYLLIRADFTPTGARKGKPCGKSFVPKTSKCSKPTSTGYANAQTNRQTLGSQVPTSILAAGAVAALAFAGAKRAKVEQYRKNVAKSALEAEKLTIEFERQLREQAARRLNKDVKNVTEFEASVYNYKDKGQDRGFSASDNAPAWFGQTRNSRGAVVMLAYADDNKFTKRGQGGYAMAKAGAFQQIWGDRDILPFANNISQPTEGLPDDMQVLSRERLLGRAEHVAGSLGRNTVKAGITVKDTLERFEFLRKNINERGFNPDAVRAAAFVAAQRRLTGKQIDIMSYSNGGNVATETLAILNEMGYRDVRVVNIAGPTFGIFKHSSEQMRTWVSEGDDFYKISGGLAFQGGNTKILKNKNIPHGLTEKIDANNREFGATAAENRRAKNSYLLDEQLRSEAYKFLTVDRRRANELLDETIWRISANKPFEGDLSILYGNQGQSKLTEYKRLLASEGERSNAKALILDEIEDRMLATWYGGYNPVKVKNAQKIIRQELQSQVTPAKNQSAITTQPKSINQIANELMQNNPTLSRKSALRQARKQTAQRKDTYSMSYNCAHALVRARYSSLWTP